VVDPRTATARQANLHLHDLAHNGALQVVRRLRRSAACARTTGEQAARVAADFARAVNG
jgi:hypothetical protein